MLFVVVAERHEIIEALRMPQFPDGDFLLKTLPAGVLSDMFNTVSNKIKPKDTPVKDAPQKMTCAECVLGKEENKKRKLLSLNDKSQNSFGFDFKYGTNYFFFLVFELGLVPTQIFFSAGFKSNNN